MKNITRIFISEYTNGVPGGTGEVTVASGGVFNATNTEVVVGEPGTITVDGGAFIASNLNSRGAITMTGSNGQIIVYNLALTNAAASFAFQGGTLDITNAVVSNGVPFTVGDGTQSATLSLRGGTNTFWHTCVIQTNATLTGVGLVQGVVTNYGAIAPGRSGPGTLSVSNLLAMTPASILDYQLDAPGQVGGGTNDLIIVQGDVKLAGQLAISPLSGFTNGTYTILTYSGTLLGNTLGMSPNRPRTHLYTIRVSGTNVLLDVRRNPPGTIITVY